jgi:NADH-quinone oxidoreductase subunit M
MESLVMNSLSYPILSIVTFLPIAGGMLLMLMPRGNDNLARVGALAVTVVTFLLSIPLFTAFDRSTWKMQFAEMRPWIPDWHINYAMGVDGISVLFVLLSTLVGILCVLISWTAVKDKVKEFHVAILIVEGAMIGVFCSLDMFLFYIFWEAMLIPMFLLIGIWGGPGRIYATIKFFLFTLVGSLLMLIGIITLYVKLGTFFIPELAAKAGSLPVGLQTLLWLSFFAAFAVKVPMFPVHTWLPDAHTEAPTAGSVILAAVLIKMGAYGFLRFSIPFFPEATKAMTMPMMVLSVVGIIYGAVICFAQTDLKRLIAYSSVSHMGFVTLGIFAMNTQGLEGGIIQMINHGVVTGGLFLMVGAVYERTHSREIAFYGGMARPLPVYATMFLILTLSSIGFPGTNGFVGEFMILLGGFTKNRTIGLFASTGVILGAGYMLWLYRRVFFQDVSGNVAALADINGREMAAVLPMLFLVFWIGLNPDAYLGFMHATVEHLVAHVNASGGAAQLAQVSQIIEPIGGIR